MAYDYHGGWENKTGQFYSNSYLSFNVFHAFKGHNAPLYGRPDEILNDKISNVVSIQNLKLESELTLLNKVTSYQAIGGTYRR